METHELETMRNKVREADRINNEKSDIINIISELESKKALIVKQPSTSFEIAGGKLYGNTAVSIIEMIVNKLTIQKDDLTEAFNAL